MTRYIVLRDRAGSWRRTAVPLSAPIAPCRAANPPRPEISTVDLDAAQLRDIVRDTGVLSLAPCMPTRLISAAPLDELRDCDAVPGWGLSAVGADVSPFSGRGVRVALLDTGIDPRHPAFRDLPLRSADFAGTGVEDANGHGTHLAGTLLGRDVEETRIGVAPGTGTLILGKAVADDGRGQSDAFLKAFLWALGEGAQIVGFALSFDLAGQLQVFLDAGYPTSLAMASAVHAYRGNLRIFETLLQMQSGRVAPLVLGAVGNDSLRTIAADFETGPTAPAAARGVLAIGAVAPGEAGLIPASFSNIGPALVAPGANIVSAAAGGSLRALNGSSMAMAAAAGIAALWAEALEHGGQAVNATTLAQKLFAAATLEGLATGVTRIDVGAGLVQAPV